jgi:hypothetical protein
MSKIPSIVSIPMLPSKFDDLEEVRKYFTTLNNALYILLQDIYTEFDGKVDTINMFCSKVTVSDTGAANTDFAVAHNLGHSQIYYTANLNANPGAACSFYKGATTWTINTAYLRCNLANQNVTFLVWA